MEIDEERMRMMVSAIGRAAVDLKFSGRRVSEQTIAEKLDQFRRAEPGIVGKKVYMDAADIMRYGRLQ
ncbi:hypothetical protein [Pantoea sp. At-9b]|jgi:hypothetical protein|uniref:hypothetical protein n=1 Tax=Pantoea sp. (strain At-9b) TaxID=592316 RepID=UPI0001B3F1CB|nr:hypothetical protein [Pantoea sp. At-9b]ADU69417.1 conserved hypothetical protein [Pantoea sp. At-9b]